MTETLHATCVAIGGRAVLLTGPPGSGKSDLALRLIDRGARLISDDGTIVAAENGRVIARAPARIAGLIEVRGLGILACPAAPEAPVALCLMLTNEVERMPPQPPCARSLAGIDIPVLSLAPFEASAPIKAERALALFGLPA